MKQVINHGKDGGFLNIIINNKPYTGDYNFVIKHYY